MTYCIRCNTPFTPRSRVQIYCSRTCQDAARFARKKAEWKAEGDLERELREQNAAPKQS